MELRNITVRELATSQHQSEYDAVLFALKPKNVWGMDVNDLPYIDTRRVISLLSKGQSWEHLQEIFCLSFRFKAERFWNARVIDYYHARNFLIQEWKRVIDIENRLSSQIESRDADKWRRAGVEKLNQFSDVISLDRLAQRYGMYPFDLGQKPYSEILYLIHMTATDSQITANYHALK